MGVTRRELFKGALTAAALALAPSLPGLPKVAQEGRIIGRVVAKPVPDSDFAECVFSRPGTWFYVDPSSPGASDARDGTDPTSPLLTMAAAMSKCQAPRGDMIVVMGND